DLRSPRATTALDPRALGSESHGGDEARPAGARLVLSFEARVGKVQVQRSCCTGSFESRDTGMSYYLLKPCRTATAFISTPKKPWRVDLTEAADRLRSRGWRVSDVKVRLIVEGEPELTLYESGKILMEADGERIAP